MPHQRMPVRRVGSPTIKNGCPVGDASLRFSAHVVGGGIAPRVAWWVLWALGPGRRDIPLEDALVEHEVANGCAYQG